jgi:hypothetical protein
VLQRIPVHLSRPHNDNHATEQSKGALFAKPLGLGSEFALPLSRSVRFSPSAVVVHASLFDPGLVRTSLRASVRFGRPLTYIITAIPAQVAQIFLDASFCRVESTSFVGSAVRESAFGSQEKRGPSPFPGPRRVAVNDAGAVRVRAKGSNPDCSVRMVPARTDCSGNDAEGGP